QPFGIGARAGHREHVADRSCRLLPTRLIEPGDRLEVVAPGEADDPGETTQRDVRSLFDTTDEVARHARREIGTANEYVDVLQASGEKRRGLARGVSSPDDDHFIGYAALRF